MSNDITAEPVFRQNRFGERYRHDVNRQLFDAAPAADVFEQRLRVDFGGDDTLFVVVGTDSGLLTEYLRGYTLGRGSRVLLVEDDEILASLDAPPSRGDHERVRTSGFVGWSAALDGCGPAHYVYGGHIELVESLGCVHDHAGRYVPMLREIKAQIARLVHALSAEVSGQLFTRTQLRNVCENALPASALRGIGTGCTAVVLGGGPSLDAALDWVVAERDKLFVIAVSRLCGKLQDLDLRPDLVVSVDPQDISYDISKRGLLWDDVPLVSAYHVSPPLLQQWRGPCLYLGEPFPWSEGSETSSANIASRGSTVSHTSAWLAFELGFERILMTGVDLCYAVGGGSHAKGGLEEEIGFLPATCDAAVMTYAGRKAGTSLRLQHGIDQMSLLGRDVNAAGARLFNLSRDAAHIESVPFLDTADVALASPRPSLTLPDEGALRGAHLERVLEELRDASRRFRTIGRRCEEAVRLIKVMDKTRNQVTGDAHQRKLERLQKRLTKEHGPWLAVVKKYAAAELLRSLTPGGFAETDHIERRAWGRSYYRTVARTTKVLLGYLEDADARTRMRLSELDAEPDVDALLDYWAQDRTPGRTLALLARFENPSAPDGTEATLPPATLARLAAEAHAFTATLREERDTGYAKQVHKGFLNPRNILRTLTFLHREEAADDLELLAARLDALDPPTDVLGTYASGLCAELADDTESALAHHRRVLERLAESLESEAGIPEAIEPLLESVLLRIVGCQLAMQDGASAAETLGLLTQVSPAYATRHARLLHLVGHDEEALHTLEQHLREQPEDWRALSQLASIYTTLGATDAADMAQRLALRTRDDHGHLRRAA